MTTLDQFAKEKSIDFIHILKSDTQGYDFEVLKGASGLLANQKIGFVHFEFIFSNMYANLPPFEEVFGFLSERGWECKDSSVKVRTRHWTAALATDGA